MQFASDEVQTIAAPMCQPREFSVVSTHMHWHRAPASRSPVVASNAGADAHRDWHPDEGTRPLNPRFSWRWPLRFGTHVGASVRQLAGRNHPMYDLRALDSRVRTWLSHVPLAAIVVLLEAIHDELRSRRGIPSAKELK